MALPKMLFWWATLVEMVPAGWVALKKMPAPACEKPFIVKQFWVTVLLRAPASAVMLPKLVSVSPLRLFLSKVFWSITEFLGPPCSPSNRLLLKVLLVIGPSPHAFLPMFT